MRPFDIPHSTFLHTLALLLLFGCQISLESTNIKMDEVSWQHIYLLQLILNKALYTVPEPEGLKEALLQYVCKGLTLPQQCLQLQKE